MCMMTNTTYELPGRAGGAKGIRTPDLLIANETRYQLRHSPSAPSWSVVKNITSAQRTGCPA